MSRATRRMSRADDRLRSPKFRSSPLHLVFLDLILSLLLVLSKILVCVSSDSSSFVCFCFNWFEEGSGGRGPKVFKSFRQFFR